MTDPQPEPKLTSAQRAVLEWIWGYTGTASTRAVAQGLYESDLNSKPAGGRRWYSQYECADPHIAALVRKGLAERPKRGFVRLTESGLNLARTRR